MDLDQSRFKTITLKFLNLDWLIFFISIFEPVQIQKNCIQNFESGPVQIQQKLIKNYESGLVQIPKNSVTNFESGPVQIPKNTLKTLNLDQSRFSKN